MRFYFACRRDSHTLYLGHASYQTLHCLKHSLCSRRSIGRDFPPREKMAFFQNCHFDISSADIYTCSFHKSLIFMKRKRHLHWPTSGRIFRLNALCACCAYKISQSKRYNACSGVVRVTGVEPARRAAPDPKSGASANSAIPAYQPFVGGESFCTCTETLCQSHIFLVFIDRFPYNKNK